MAIKVSNVTVIDNNKQLMNYVLDTREINSSTTASASGIHYVAKSSLTLNLPSSPSVGEVIGFSNQSNSRTCVLGRNGRRIMGLDENMVINVLYVPLKLQYSGSSMGWVFV